MSAATREQEADRIASMIGQRCYIETLGGDYVGTVRGTALSVSWTLLTDVRGNQDSARAVAAVALDGAPTVIDCYSGGERVWPAELVHPFDESDPRWIVIDGRIYTR